MCQNPEVFKAYEKSVNLSIFLVALLAFTAPRLFPSQLPSCSVSEQTKAPQPPHTQDDAAPGAQGLSACSRQIEMTTKATSLSPHALDRAGESIN